MKYIIRLITGSLLVQTGLFFLSFGLLEAASQTQKTCSDNPASNSDNERKIDRYFDTHGKDSMANGSYHFSTTDLSVPGPVPIVLTRYYDSSMQYGGPMGVNFEFSFNRRVEVDGNYVYYYTGKGCRVPVGAASTGGGFSYSTLTPTRDHYTLSYNDIGGCTVTDKAGNQDIMGPNGLIVKSLDRNGNELDFNRDENGNLLSVVDPVHGTSITFTIDPTTKVILSATDSFGRTVTYSYGTVVSSFDERANPTGGVLFTTGIIQVTHPATVEYPSGTTEQYAYDEWGRMTSEIDGNGHTVVSNSYFDWSDMSFGGGYVGAPFNYSLKSQTIAGNTTNYSYTTVIIPARGFLNAGIYIAQVTKTDPKGFVTITTNDQTGNITNQKVYTTGLHSNDPSSGVYETDYQYDTVYNMTKETEPDGNGTSYTYDSLDNPLTTTKFSPSGATVDSTKGTQTLTATTTTTYEPRFNQVASVTDPNGNVTTYDYGTASSNPSGNLLSITSPTTAAGRAVEYFTYNSLGQVLTDTAADGTVTKNVYDDATGYLIQTIKDYGTGRLNATTSYTYDEYGHVATTTDPNGNVTTTITDAQDHVQEIDGASGEVEKFTYDADGKVLTDEKKLADGSYQETETVYNEYEQVVATRQYSSGTSYVETDYAYDTDGNRSTTTDPLGHTTTVAYDERNKAYLMTDALGNTVKYDFDGEGNTVKLTDELGKISTYTYDGLGKLEQKTFPDGSYDTWTYDGVGNITALRTTGGHTVTQTYDACNRMLSQSYTAASGPSTITNVYDIMGRLSATTEGGASLAYSFDALGRNTSFTDQAGLTSTYTYDLAGNRTSTTYPTGVTVQRAHDASNRVTTLKDGSGNIQATYSYDQLDRPTGMTLANSTSVAWNYDLMGRITSVNNTLQTGNRNYSYAYDNASRRTSVTEPRGTVGFGYSNRNEVNGVTEPSGSPFSDQSFAYDAAYNRSNWTNGTTSTSYTVNNLNQYTAVASATPSWNGDGGLASYNGNTYTYDGLMRLVEVDNSLGKYLFSYDPTGRRVKKVIESPSGTVLETFSYHYDSSEVAVEYQPGATWTYYLGLGIDQPVLRVNGTAKQWYYADAQGSISAVADNSGNLLEAYEYTPQGQFQVTNASGTVESGTLLGNYILYTGRNYDFETGNYFYRARYYSPDLGRFISRDPLSGAEFSQGTNLYAYCGNNFLNAVDPTGMDGDFSLDGDPNSFTLTSPLDSSSSSSSPSDSDNTANQSGQTGTQRAIEGLEAVGNFLASGLLMAAVLPEAASTVVDGPVGIAGAALTGLTAAGYFMKGVADIGAALTNDGSMAQKLENAPLTPNQMAGSIADWNNHAQGAAVGTIGDNAVSAITGGADFMNATTARESIDAGLGVSTTSIDFFNQAVQAQPLPQQP